MFEKQPGQAHHPIQWDHHLIRTACTTAHHHAARYARQRRLPRTEREDLAQDILLAILEASPYFDPARGSWSTFVTLVARRLVIDHARRPAAPEFLSLTSAEGQRLVVTLASPDDPQLSVEFSVAAEALPDEPHALLTCIVRHADLAAARDSSDASPATFYRQLGDLRCWLRVVGLAPPSSGVAAKRAQHTREKECVPNP